MASILRMKHWINKVILQILKLNSLRNKKIDLVLYKHTNSVIQELNIISDTLLLQLPTSIMFISKNCNKFKQCTEREDWSVGVDAAATSLPTAMELTRQTSELLMCLEKIE